MRKSKSVFLPRWAAVLSLFLFAAAFIFAVPIRAQPGDESRYYERAMRQIKTLDAHIAQQPGSADLYYRRGLIYLSQFSVHPERVELRGVVYVDDPGGKALADLNRAIEIGAASEHYAARGKYYEYRWQHTVTRRADIAKLPWEKLRSMYWYDPLFKLALADYQRALDISQTNRDSAVALGRLAWLYRGRTMSMTSPEVAKVVLANSQTRLVYDDYDTALELTRRYIEFEKPPGSVFQLRDIYQEKARAAAEFNDHETAMKALSSAIDEVAAKTPTDSNCTLYTLRGDLYQKLNDPDSAIRDYTFPIEKGWLDCFEIYEKRGDAYSSKGDWGKAAADYSVEVAKYSHPQARPLTKRARAYIRLGEAGKALADLNEAMTLRPSCPVPHELRAEAYRMLGQNNLAAEDETWARKYARNKTGCAF